MQDQRPTTSSDRATPRGRHHHGPGRTDVLCLGLVIPTNDHNRHTLNSGPAASTQTGGAA